MEQARTIAAGDGIPDVTLFEVRADGAMPVQSRDWFGGKRVALFSVPGAFTSTCSRQLPGYVHLAQALKGKGVDKIACTAVNDASVLRAWNQRDGGDAVTMLADGNGDFVRALGLVMDGRAHGLGYRGRRFSMVVAAGVIEQLNIEAPGQLEVSSAEYMLQRL